MATKKKTSKKQSAPKSPAVKPKPKRKAAPASAKKKAGAMKARPAKKPAAKKKAPVARKPTRSTKTRATKTAVAKKKATAAPKKAAVKATRPAATAKAGPASRRDATGHIDPTYAADLLEKSSERATTDPHKDAFFHGRHTNDDLAEELAENAVKTMTSGEDDRENSPDQTVSEEVGGPFVASTAGAEFAAGTDASNPEDADREPFPTT